MKRMAIVLRTDCQGRGYIAHYDTKNPQREWGKYIVFNYLL